LEQLPPGSLARILEALSTDDRQVIWQLVPDAKKEEILLEAEDSVRVELLFEIAPQIQVTKIRVFDLHEGRLRQIPIQTREDLKQIKPIWVDLVNPEVEELAWAGETFGVELPDPKNLTDLETSARLYVEDNGEVHLHSDFLLDREDESRNVMVAFILNEGTLFSIRNEELPVFLFCRRRRYVRILNDDARDTVASFILYIYHRNGTGWMDHVHLSALFWKPQDKKHPCNNQKSNLMWVSSRDPRQSFCQ